MGSSASKKAKLVHNVVLATKAFENGRKISIVEVNGLNILIVSHRSDLATAEEIRMFLLPRKCEYLDENGSLRFRAEMVNWAQIIILAVSNLFQREVFLEELVCYAQILKKKLITVILENHFEPSGCVGLLTKAYGQFAYWKDGGELACKFLSDCVERFEGKVDSNQPIVPLPETKPAEKFVVLPETVACNGSVYVSATLHDSPTVAIIQEGKSWKMGSFKDTYQRSFDHSSVQLVVDCEVRNPEICIAECQVFLAVLSENYQNSARHEKHFEMARRYKKCIIPVKAGRFMPDGWLALAVAGKLFYRLSSKQEANMVYQNFHDSSPMKEFLSGVNNGLVRVCSEEDRQKSLQSSLQLQIENCQKKLKMWPPVDCFVGQAVAPIPDKRELLPESESKLSLNFVFYTITRTEFKFDKPLYDEYGAPLRKSFHCMLSYCWKSQKLVVDCAMQFKMCNINFWLDMYGGMQGNVYQSMATAIEDSNSIVVFLSEDYQKSVNCNLELKYAVALEKPLIFVVPNSSLHIKDWIKPIFDQCMVIEIASQEDLGTLVNGYPKLYILTTAIQKLNKWASAQPKKLHRDCSADVYKLQLLLENSLNALSLQEGQERFQICTRCEAKFDGTSRRGCGKHSSYYVGGTIIAGRWVCCNQTDKNGAGCQAAEHTIEKRKWKQITGYDGCHQWRPA